jgi:hypothetical protein
VNRGLFCECESSVATAADRVHRNLNAVSDTLKPGHVDLTYTKHEHRISSVSTVYNVALGKNQWLTTNRKLRIRKDSSLNRMLDRSPHTVPTYTVPTYTVPATVVTENLFRVSQWDTDNTTYSVFAPQPVVKCAQGDVMQGRNWTSNLEIEFVRDDGTARGVLSNMGDVVRQVRRPSESVFRSEQAWQYFDPVWMPSPETGSSSLVGVFFKCRWTINENISPSRGEQPLLKNLTEILEMRPEERSNCSATVSTITAVWNTSEAILDAKGLRFNSLTDWWEVVLGRPITLNVSSVEVANATLQRTIDSLYDDYMITHEDVIGTAFALAISEIPTGLFPNPEFPFFLDKYDIIDRNYTDEDLVDMAKFTYTLTEFSYGYGTTSTSVYLSMVVISFYCVFTILYLAYILITGSTSTAWNSAIELVALALQSQRSSHLGKISVGIDTLSAFNEGVGIRVNAENELELVFANDRDTGSRDLRKIERNKEY